MLAVAMMKNERQWKKVNKNTYDISSIKRVTRTFLEVSLCSRAKQRQKKGPKKLCCTFKVALLTLLHFIFYLNTVNLSDKIIIIIKNKKITIYFNLYGHDLKI